MSCHSDDWAGSSSDVVKAEQMMVRSVKTGLWSLLDHREVMEEGISVVIGGLVSHVGNLQINTMVRHKNWMFKNKKFCGYKFAN